MMEIVENFCVDDDAGRGHVAESLSSESANLMLMKLDTRSLQFVESVAGHCEQSDNYGELITSLESKKRSRRKPELPRRLDSGVDVMDDDGTSCFNGSIHEEQTSRHRLRSSGRRQQSVLDSSGYDAFGASVKNDSTFTTLTTTVIADKTPCKVCGRLFASRYMANHMRSHTSRRSNTRKIMSRNRLIRRDHAMATSNNTCNSVKTSKLITKQKLYECYICDRAFSKEDMPQHIMSHDTTTSTEQSLTSEDTIVGHDKVDAHNFDGDQFECSDNYDEAGQDTDDEDGRTADEDVTTEKRKAKRRSVRSKSPCQVCGALFNKYYMAVHMRSHTGEKPFNCPQCDKQFVSANSLNAHVKNCHGEMRGKIQCDICGRLVASKMSLKQHLLTHSDEKPFQCHVCGKSFKQCAQLSAHVKTHADGMPYQCEHCGHRYKSVTGLIRHRQYHHLGIRKKYPCDICDKVFTRHSKLKDHIMWHKGTSPYVCKYCGKRLRSRKTLNTHLLIHEDIKPYECEVCGKAFRQNCVLKRHLTIHTGIKPFRCDRCGKQFIHRVYLVKHTCEVQDGARTFLSL